MQPWQAPAAAPAAPAGGSLPAYQTILYIKTGLELVLILLAIPYLIVRLFKDPAGALRDASASKLR